jgi:hypothetical protein
MTGVDNLRTTPKDCQKFLPKMHVPGTLLKRAPFQCHILGYTTLKKGLVYKHLTVHINCILRKTKR